MACVAGGQCPERQAEVGTAECREAVGSLHERASPPARKACMVPGPATGETGTRAATAAGVRWAGPAGVHNRGHEESQVQIQTAKRTTQ